MMATAELVWTRTPNELGRSVQSYGTKVLQALHLLATHFAAQIEAFAKTHARWKDRTGAARQGLTAIATKMAAGVVITLMGGVAYQVWLEIANAGRYAIILRSLEAFYAPLMAAVRALVGGR